MNNTIPEENKNMKEKSIKVAGFLAIVAFIAWASVQIVSYIPSAFTSLASLAGGISQYRESMDGTIDGPLSVTPEVTSTETQKSVAVNWEKDSREGTYAFSYSCIDGVAIDIIDTDGLRAITCDTRYGLGDTSTITIVVNSEKQRDVTIPYTISFMRPNDSGPIRSGEQTLAVTNKSIGTAEIAKDSETKPDDTPTKTEPVAEKPTTKNPKPVTVVPRTPEYTYAIPTSDPNGFTDLAAKFIAIGDISNGTLVTRSIERNGDGAFQFEIKNLGTKTSAAWHYSVTLPDNDTYTSASQTPLKPNERAVITLGFDTPDITSHDFVVLVTTKDEAKTSNNSFKKVITLTK